MLTFIVTFPEAIEMASNPMWRFTVSSSNKSNAREQDISKLVRLFQ